MTKKYIAKVMCGTDELIVRESDDIDELYEWMLIQANGKLGDIHGQIIDNKSLEVVRKFRKAPPD